MKEGIGKIDIKAIYQEFYGVTYEILHRFSDLCKENGIIFCDCILGDQKDWGHFKRYIKKKYGISKHDMDHNMGFGMIYLNIGPTSNIEKYNSNVKKIKELGGEIYDLQEKIQENYTNSAKGWDIIIHSTNAKIKEQNL